jgi:Thermolysin metallopeptidase, alpha-helical domain/Putative Ig domain
MSGGGTVEFVADVFGTSTEWFANEPAPFDTPDYTVGEAVNVTGNGPVRYMYRPDLVGMPDCYSSAVDTMEAHDASGPGDHWFYLLAEGANPTDGQPSSPDCGSHPLAGVGIQTALTVFYNAMLRKTSASSYGAYRTWTLAAAMNVYSSSCAVYSAVKAAWDAVNVPAQPGEPYCGVIANNPGDQTSVIGVPAGLNLTASNAPAPYTWQVSGLPPGVSSDAAGHVTGTPTAYGTFTVTASVSSPGFLSNSTTFTWTVFTIVPDFVGLTQIDADGVLLPAGLRLGIEHDKVQGDCENIGVVTAQWVNPGTPIRAGTPINFDFGVRPKNCP